jgi:hypothetical protein
MLTAREALWREFAKLHREVLAIVKEVSWSLIFGQSAKLGSPEREDGRDDREADEVFCGVQGESGA